MLVKANGADSLTRQPRLLVADTDNGTLEMLQPYLERHGYEVRIAFSAHETLETITTYHPDLLIMELNLPDRNGYEVTLQLRQDPTSTYLPIILITAQDEDRTRLQSMVSGADDYLAKPVVERELMVRVQALLRTKNHIERLLHENHRLLRSLEKQNKELEQALQSAQEADSLKRNILATVSHEMNTPLLQVKSAVHLLVEDVRRSDPDNTPARLAAQSLSRLEGIIQNITQLARSEHLQQEPFILREAVDLAMRNIERSWVAKEEVGRIRREFEADLPMVAGDLRAVARVLGLFLDNAIKFDPDHRPIKIIARRQGEDQVYIAVKDQGIGIPKKHQDLIFQEFYQVDSSTTRRFGGAGIGLALAKLLCDKMGTEIKVESRPKKGSTFSFTLPAADWIP
jgi:signal transduction histidine kinase